MALKIPTATELREFGNRELTDRELQSISDLFKNKLMLAMLEDFNQVKLPVPHTIPLEKVISQFRAKGYKITSDDQNNLFITW
jgi:hypothetical protein